VLIITPLAPVVTGGAVVDTIVVGAPVVAGAPVVEDVVTGFTVVVLVVARVDLVVDFVVGARVEIGSSKVGRACAYESMVQRVDVRCVCVGLVEVGLEVSTVAVASPWITNCVQIHQISVWSKQWNEPLVLRVVH